MKKFLFFIFPLLFLINVKAETITQYSHGYDEYTGVCESDSFYYILDDNLGQQGFGTFAYSYTNANFARVRADINYQLLPNTNYEISFSNPLHEYGSNPTYGWTAITPDSVLINVVNGCGGTVMSSIPVTSVSYPNGTVYDYDLVVIRFTTPSYIAKPWFSVDLQSGYTSQGIYQITTGNQARLDNIYLSIVTSGDSGDSSNQDIINNQTNNTNIIVNNQTQNTQAIIDNQNQNTQQEIESQQVCDIIDSNDIVIDNKFLQANGSLGNNNTNGITDYIKIDKNTRLTRIINTGFKAYFCFYDVNKTLISCVSNQDITTNEAISIPNNSIYVRFTFNKIINEPQYQICTNGNQALDDTLNDSSIDNGLGQDFFDNFTDNDFGLSQIITIPLNTIQELTSTSCVTINVPIPFTNETVPLPCLTTIYQKFPTLFNLWQVVSFGLIAYFIAIDIFHIVKGFKDPESDKVEVLDL